MCKFQRFLIREGTFVVCRWYILQSRVKDKISTLHKGRGWCFCVDPTPITPFTKTVKHNQECNLRAPRYRHQKLSCFHISYLLYSLHLYFIAQHCKLLRNTVLWFKWHHVFHIHWPSPFHCTYKVVRGVWSLNQHRSMAVVLNQWSRDHQWSLTGFQAKWWRFGN